ncbi:uncharacterized protein LOC132750075 [Ruditapes philippinarum]|uniref:uncharacterized protein LOC132750075 n=1 Tax=Ruditapes philippinarum TaxID=129788 RepID=UPI00295BB035|nr:uncharacterized protein LOC132750075 [Ruditapes philippinarum]
MTISRFDYTELNHVIHTVDWQNKTVVDFFRSHIDKSQVYEYCHGVHLKPQKPRVVSTTTNSTPICCYRTARLFIIIEQGPRRCIYKVFAFYLENVYIKLKNNSTHTQIILKNVYLTTNVLK